MKISSVVCMFIIALLVAGIFAIPGYLQEASEQQAMNSGSAATWNIPIVSDVTSTANKASHVLDPENSMMDQITK